MWVNTELFRTEAKNFIKYGRYCDDPPGTAGFREYWDEQLRRCQEGYSVGGKRITGHHYGYLNFAKIMLTEEDDVEKVSKKRKRTGTKISTFPDFWDGDYEYFWVVEIARNGIEENEYKKLGLGVNILKLDGGYHVVLAKARRKGFSYKTAWIATNIYNTIRKSAVVIGAFEKKYLYPKGTMTMVTSYMDFLNEHTAWTKRRQVVNRQDHRKASFLEKINGQDTEKGYQSEVIGVTFKDNPDAARGKDSNLVVFEEAGVFDNLKEAFKATEPSVTDGSLVTGQILIFGTGGDMDGGTVDFEAMFYNPDPYNLIPIENIWDEGAQGTSSGYFFPQFKNLKGFYDKDGNSDLEGAKAFAEEVRANIKNTAKSAKVYDDYVIEYCFSPSEAFMQSNANIFPVTDLNAQRNLLIRDKTLGNLGVAGVLDEEGEEVVFKPSDSVRPITKFPHDTKDDTTGAVVIYQPPYKGIGGKVPDNVYLVAHDPYAMDTDGDKLSLGASYVIKRINEFSKPDDMIVATYVARPESQDDYNKNLFLLAKYYNAKIGFENDRGEVVPYAKRVGKTGMLLEEPELFDKTNNFRLKKMGRKYGISISSPERKSQGMVYLRDWLKSFRTRTEDGKPVFNYHYIYDIPTLEELIRYKPKGNFDRVSALIVGMYYLKAMANYEIEAPKEEYEEDFFDQAFFDD